MLSLSLSLSLDFVLWDFAIFPPIWKEEKGEEEEKEEVGRREMKGNGGVGGGGVGKKRSWSAGGAGAGAGGAFFLSHSPPPSWGLLRRTALCMSLLLFTLYTTNLLFLSPRHHTIASISAIPPNQTHFPLLPPPPPSPPAAATTSLRHVVFGIAASARLWSKRKDYIKLWFSPAKMRGYIWLDKPIKISPREASFFPEIQISGDTSKFPYSHRGGRRAAVRISRIVSETLSLPNFPPETRWLVMGDDDTVFFPENLVRVLSKYDHRQPYYIGGISESHLQNIFFSYSMAYGGGGFAVSRPLAEQLAAMQDRCIRRYPDLYGSDDRIQACMSELGVPLTRELGFHQFDIYGSLLGLLAAHPLAPIVSLHHLDVVEPVIPGKKREKALRTVMEGPGKIDQAAMMQQSICYDGDRGWTVMVAWGYVVQLIRGVMAPREVEIPARTFLNWYRREDYRGYALNTRPVARNPCQKPFVFYVDEWGLTRNGTEETTVTRYVREKGEQPHPVCKWKMEDPSVVTRIVVYKRADPHLWDRAPRRNCCRARRTGVADMAVEVGICRDGEISEPKIRSNNKSERD